MRDLIRCACTRINDPWRRHCGGCGRHLAPSCTCGFVNAKSDVFCGGCGSRTMAATLRPSTDDESKTIPLDVIDVVS